LSPFCSVMITFSAQPYLTSTGLACNRGVLYCQAIILGQMIDFQAWEFDPRVRKLKSPVDEVLAFPVAYKCHADSRAVRREDKTSVR